MSVETVEQVQVDALEALKDLEEAWHARLEAQKKYISANIKLNRARLSGSKPADVQPLLSSFIGAYDCW